VNFFAHAVLATERSPDAAFVLGAMLPDLSGFARVRLGELAPGALRDGVRFHHASDTAFHGHRAFGAHCAALARTLEARGVRRGPARGVAHVASELLLDGWLAGQAGVPRAYRDSLAAARELIEREQGETPWRSEVAAVCARVHAAPLPEAYEEVAFVCERVERALAPRPFLALASSEQHAVAAVLRDEASGCARWAPSVLDGVRRAFPASGNPETLREETR
jgi:D-aminopeptidase